MMEPPLFYCASIPEPGQRAELDAAESKHLTGSRRLQPQDRIALIDGSGVIAQAVIRAIASRGHEVVAEIVSRDHQPRESPRMHLAAALPKGDRQRTLLDMTTQLGMASFTPLLCDRSIVKPPGTARDRWRRTCLEACKQCRLPYLPQIHDPATPEEFSERMRSKRAELFVGHGLGKPIHAMDAPGVEVALLIGPEGGFTAEEIGALRSAGVLPLSLGSYVLRVETAAVVGLSYLKLRHASRG